MITSVCALAWVLAPGERTVLGDGEPSSRIYAGPESVESIEAAPVEPPAEPSTSPTPAPTPKADAPPPPVERTRARGAWLDEMFVPTALLEVDYRQRAHDAEGNSGFAMARARLGMRLQPTVWFSAVGTAEFVGDAPYLLDGFVSFTPLRWLEVNAGYSKAPLFASFRHEPVALMPMPMRSAIVNEMRVRRDVGVETRFVPHRAPIEAILRLGNGNGGLPGNDNDTPTGYAALDLVLGRAWVAGRNKLLGLRLGGASLLDDAGPHDTIAGRTPMGFTYVQPLPGQGLRSITTAHVIGYAGPVRLVAEGAWAYESRVADDDGDADTPAVEAEPVQTWGATAELAWVIRGTWRQPARQPDEPGDRGDRWDGGAVELAGRADRMWLGRGTAEVADGGATTGSLTLKWWPTFFLALALYGDVTRFDVPPVQTPTREWSWTALVRGSFFWARSPRR